MSLKFFLILFAVAALSSPVTPAAALEADQGAAWHRHETAEDRAAIEAVIEQFRLGIKAKDGKALSGLLLNSRIVFNEIGDQASVDKGRGFDVHFDGLGGPGFSAFSRYLAGEKAQVEERFSNIVIEQDGPLALVTFDYQFVANGKVTNGGIEHWMLRKIDGQWKIFSVVWTAT